MRRIVLLVFIVIIVGDFNCFAKIKVTTSIFILSTLVKQIGGNKVTVSYVIPPSTNPHLFSPTPRDLLNFKNADLFIGIGYGFEFWLKRVSYLRTGKRSILLSDFYKNPIDEVKVGGEVFANPHIWLDMEFMGNVAIPKITQALCQLDKRDCQYFRFNMHILEKRLRRIEIAYKQYAMKFKKLCFVDVKPAFEYLLKSIGRKSCGIVVNRGNQMPRMGDIKKLVKNCTCNKGLVIYISNANAAGSIAELLGYKPVQLNPLGNPENPKENTYIKLLRYDLLQLEKSSK